MCGSAPSSLSSCPPHVLPHVGARAPAHTEIRVHSAGLVPGAAANPSTAAGPPAACQVRQELPPGGRPRPAAPEVPCAPGQAGASPSGDRPSGTASRVSMWPLTRGEKLGSGVSASGSCWNFARIWAFFVSCQLDRLNVCSDWRPKAFCFSVLGCCFGVKFRALASL